MKRPFHRFAIFAISLMLINSAYAQHSFYLGVQGGISIPDLKAGSDNQNPLANGYSSRLGADFGVIAVLPVKNNFSIETGVDYSEQGGKHNGLQALSNPYGNTPEFFYASFNNSAHLNYLLIPVMARFDFDLSKKLKLYVQAGGFAGFLLSAKSVTSGSSYLYADSLGQEQLPNQPGESSFDTTTSIKSSINSFNAGVIGAVGLTYDMGKGKLFIEGGGNYGIINIQKYAVDGSNYSGAAVIHVGYLYAFECKKKR